MIHNDKCFMTVLKEIIKFYYYSNLKYVDIPKYPFTDGQYLTGISSSFKNLQQKMIRNCSKKE